jgi:hypothetical protein
MGQFYYNRLKNNRIKGMSLGLFVVLINILAIYTYYVFAGKDNVSVFVVVAISLAAMGLLFIVGQVAFGQVIEKANDGQVTTFFKLGTKKLKFKKLGQLVSSSLTQDNRKYYCLTIKTDDGHDLTLEKYPTLNEAKERLEELRMRIG